MIWELIGSPWSITATQERDNLQYAKWAPLTF